MPWKGTIVTNATYFSCTAPIRTFIIARLAELHKDLQAAVPTSPATRLQLFLRNLALGIPASSLRSVNIEVLV